MSKSQYILVAVAIFLSGCIGPSIKLSERGERVQVKTTEELDKTEVKGSSLRCEMGANGRPYADNRRACINSMRNQASQMNANIIVIETEKVGANASVWKGTCSNCVELTATAYRGKNVPEPIPVAEKEEKKEEKSDDSQSQSTPLKAPDTGGGGVRAPGGNGEERVAATPPPQQQIQPQKPQTLQQHQPNPNSANGNGVKNGLNK